MERFLERLSISQYRNNLILKGGTLVAAMVRLDNRSTMDVDATIKNLPLNKESAKKIVKEITAIPIEDGMSFEITSVTPIMDEADYPGIRVMMDTTLENMHTPLKIDFSTGDIITPREVSYSFRLLFEDRTISILAYNLETVLAEKVETLLARGTANTRMRDFYDIYVLTNIQAHNIDNATLRACLISSFWWIFERVFRQARKRTRGIIKEIMQVGADEAWRKTRRKYAGMEILNRLLKQHISIPVKNGVPSHSYRMSI